MNLPNRLTLLRMCLIPVLVWLALIQTPAAQLAAAVCFVLAALTDLIDGRIARGRNLITDFGKLMDPMADKLLVMAALVVLCSQQRAHVIAVLLILGREFVIMSIRLVALSRGVVIAADGLGKLKTTLQLTAIPLLLIVPVFPPLEDALRWAGNVLLWASALVSIWSCVSYIVRNKEVISP